MRYFLRLNVNIAGHTGDNQPHKWEEVDEYLFNHSHQALSGDTERYAPKTYVLFDEVTGKLAINVSDITQKELSFIARLVGAKPELISLTNGFCDTPAFVPLRIRKNEVLHNLGTGKNYKAC